jgi:predicted GNAT family acetyltransferase
LVSEVRDNPALNRFELDIEGGIAVAYYSALPGRITITHTEVPTALRGRGIGSVLVRGALELARTEGLKVVSRCPFVSAYLGKHPEYNDLLG